jgi:hypothetical protein
MPIFQQLFAAQFRLQRVGCSCNQIQEGDYPTSAQNEEGKIK